MPFTGLQIIQLSDLSPLIQLKHVLGTEKNHLEETVRPPDKSANWKIIFFISHPKHMLWVLKRIVSMRRFF